MKDGSVETDPEFTEEVPKVEFPSLTQDRPAPVADAFPSSPSDRFTSLSVEEAQARVAQMLLTVGANITSSSPGRIDASLTSKGEPNVLVTILLACICIVPAIIYWVVKAKAQVRPVALTFLAQPTGTRIAVHADPTAMIQLAPALAVLP